MITCPACLGLGQVEFCSECHEEIDNCKCSTLDAPTREDTCPVCEGDGEIEDEDDITINKITGDSES